MQIDERLADLCLELCKIPSVTGEEAEICEHILGWARRLLPDEQIVRYDNSLVLGDLTGSSGRPIVALVGHLDTVPPHEGAPPPHRDGDRVIARGSSDMKSGVAVAMALFEDLDLERLPFELILVLYEREEGPHLESGLRTLLEEVPRMDRIDLAIVMEPTDNIIQVGCLGTLHATLTFQGKSAHSARPWLGKNAITAAGSLLCELEEKSPIDVEIGGQVFREVFTVTMAAGGRYRNVVPDVFTLNLNYRFAPGKGIETAKSELCALVADRAAVEFTDLSPSGSVPWESHLLQRLIETSGKRIGAKQAWTDVARLSEAGIDAVNYGPGLAAEAHQSSEYCTVSGLLASYEDVRRFLETPLPSTSTDDGD